MNMFRLVLLLLWLPLVASAIPRAINPVDVLAIDSGSVQPKLWPIDSLIQDSVAHADTATFSVDSDSSRASYESNHADSSDTAAFAHVALRALGLKLGFSSNVVPVVRDQDSVLSETYRGGAPPDTYSARLHYSPLLYSVSALSGTWGNSLNLYSYPSTIYNSAYFGITTLGNGYAGTRAAIFFNNFSTIGYGRESAVLSWRKRDAASTGHNDFELLTYSQSSATTWLRHIFINGETGEMIFQDTCPDINRTVRYPVRFRNGGMRTTKAIIDTTPLIPSPTLVMVKSPTGDTIGSRRIDSLDVDSSRTAGSAYHGVSTGRHAVSTGTSTWGQSTIRESDSCVGIGVASSDDRRLAVSFSPVNESGYGLFLAYSPTVTADVYGGGSAARILALTNVASPYTDLNSLVGIGGYAFHNSTGRCYGGAYGLQFEYGTLGATTGRLDRGVGVYIGGRSDGVGPVNLLQDIYIAARTGAVTPDAEWCIYSDHRATSRFIGSVQSGTSSNRTDIDTSGITMNGKARINWNRYYPDSVVYVEGSSGSSVNALRHIGDSVYAISEASGGTGIDATIHFNGVTGFNMVQVIGGYIGTSTHAVSVMIRDTTKSQWHTYSAMRYVDVVDTTASSRCLYNYSFFPDSTQNYIASNGKVILRILHKGVGSSSHRLFFSEVVIKQ